MKRLLYLILILIPSLSFSQMTTTNPDTVCYQVPGSIYEFNNTPGLTYHWSVALPGNFTGQGTNQIQVDWSNASPGLISNAVSCYATNSIGCSTDTVYLDVFIYNVNILLTPIADMCYGSPCQDLIANPSGGIWNGVGVSVDQFCPDNSGPGTFTIGYTYTSSDCIFNNAMSITVYPPPTISPIQHN
jgi:hypothetical protein